MTDRRKNIFTAISASAVVISVALTFSRYFDSFLRLLTAFKDVGTSFSFYFSLFLYKLFNVGDGAGNVTVTQLPDVDIQKFIPFDLDELVRKWEALGPALLKKEWFVTYCQYCSYYLRQFLIVLLLLLPILVILGFCVYSILCAEQPPELRNVDSKPLKIFKKLTFDRYLKVKSWFKDFRTFFKDRMYYLYALLCIWVINLNVATIALEILAFLVYFSCALAVQELPNQLLKLLIDMIIMFSGAPFVFWAIVFWIGFDKLRRAIAYDKLKHNELKNRGFINILNLAIIICGTMGLGKTTLLADMLISQCIMFRQKAFDKMQQWRYRFPNFPFPVLEAELKRQFEKKKNPLKNLLQIRLWVSSKKKAFKKNPTSDRCFGYDLKHFSDTYDDGLKIVDVWWMIETYAQLFFVYTFTDSLIIANLSVRDPSKIEDTGHTPKWDFELFKRPSVPLEDDARHAKILDFDALRPGVKYHPENKTYGSIEFGALGITEIGKELGNSKENTGFKKSDLTCNPLNDKTVEFIKVIRTLSTIDFEPFIRLFSDEQRPDSLGSNVRDTFSLIWITDKSELKNAMPGFLFGDIFYDITNPLWKKMDKKTSTRRSDNTLLGYIIKNLLSAFMHYHERIYDTFGYYKLSIDVESGRMDGEREAHEYFISKKKVHARTYATDCFNGIVSVATLVSGKGLGDLPEYETERPSADEFDLQSSHFIKNLNSNVGNIKQDNV